VQACCSDHLVRGAIVRAHCLDGEALGRIGGGDWQGVPGPSHHACGCVQAVDIGRPNTCPHGCFYCLENPDKAQAVTRYRAQDPAAVFLGLNREESARAVAEIRARPPAAA